MKLLLLNPNRSEWITERVAAGARAVLLPGESLHTVTSTEGPDVVKSPQQTLAAAQEVRALAAAHGPGYDAVILGISLDCGLQQVRVQQGQQVVIGMTEAACLAACTYGPCFGVLTVGAVMQPLYVQHIQALGLASRCVGVEAPECAQAFQPVDGAFDAAALPVLASAVRALRSQGADSVVLAGAVLCGLGPELTRRTGVVVWEGPVCAVGVARMRHAHAAWLRA